MSHHLLGQNLLMVATVEMVESVREGLVVDDLLLYGYQAGVQLQYNHQL